MPIFSRHGIKTEQRRVGSFAELPGVILASALCFLASEGQGIVSVKQGPDFCVVEAEIPSDVWSWAGSMVIAMTHMNSEVQVEAGTTIKGQLYDWEKSNRILARFFKALSDPGLR